MKKWKRWIRFIVSIIILGICIWFSVDLMNKDFNEMEVTRFNNLNVITMMPVVESVKAPSAYEDPSLKNILGE